MDKAPDTEDGTPETEFSRSVGQHEQRMLRARRAGPTPVYSGFAMFGIIGWSIAAPTLLCTLLGSYLDKRHPDVHSWTLALMVAGLMLGCANAWHWMARQEAEMQEDGNR
jgi:ATP synthase protein I